MRLFLLQKLLYKNINDWKYPRKIPNANGNWYGLTYNSEHFVAISNRGYLSMSSDGETWTTATERSGAMNENIVKIANNVSLLVNIGVWNFGTPDVKYYSNYSSNEGDSFSQKSEINVGAGVGVDTFRNVLFTYGDNKFVTLVYYGPTYYYENGNYKIYFSTNGNNWTSNDTDLHSFHNYWSGLTYFDGKFIVVNKDGYISTSTDGITWTTPTQVNNLNISNSNKNLCSNGTKIYSVSENGYYAESSDGETWTTEKFSPHLDNNNWTACACSNSTLVAINQDGYYSIKGI